MLSLNARLLIAASLVLACFLGLTGYALDKAFRDNAEKFLQETLQAHVSGLIAAAEFDDQGKLYFPRVLPEARYNTPALGLYAQVARYDGTQFWQSPSLQGWTIRLTDSLNARETRFTRQRADQHMELYVYAMGVTFDPRDQQSESYTFAVAEDMNIYHEQVNNFRRLMWGWLGAVAIILLAVQGTILRWTLGPLRKVARDLAEIEAGQHNLLEGRYPREMLGLTENLNALLLSQREHLERYRKTLGNLAHSLKTPLAVLRGALDRQQTADLAAVAEEQVKRMTEIVDYELQRAATSGRIPLSAPVSVANTIRKISASLDKVYADKKVRCQVQVDKSTRFHGDQGDLMELIGNLLDNAYKWCNSRVVVGANVVRKKADPRESLIIWVEDDGPGFTPDKTREVLQRGVRHDYSTPGHGIGLAIAQDIVRLYDGKLDITASGLGGAKLTVHLPGHR